uniref:Cadherin domain-containing protein n=1 Tax=Lepisosteus oculatus TaxID=7918 RepID=W5MZS7_LEPOC
KIHITVTDANDNAPVFSQALYKAVVVENAPEGTLVTTVSAYDADKGSNGLLTYAISHLTDEIGNMFQLDPHTGELKVKGRIDYEKTQHHQINIQAKDEGNLVDSSKIVIEVTDVNDNTPVINLVSLSSSIPENVPTDTVIAMINVQDQDSGNNGIILDETNIKGEPVSSYISVNSNTGIVHAVRSFDFEQIKDFQICVKAQDAGSPPLSSNSSSIVYVNSNSDANDNAPVFNQSVYKATVLENASKNTFITTINASDADTGSNGHVTYSFSDLEGNVRDIFNLDENTGAIYLVGQIDFEKEKKYEINVEAKDHGGLADSSKVVVEVIDVNDNAPVITVMSFSSPVSEDSAPGTTVAIINVKDLDSGENGRVSCSINRNLPFKIISSLTNYYTLVTDAVLDRETTSEYNITVIATDSGSPSLTTSKILTLKVSDVNDNAPVFEQSAYTAYVAENNSPGLSVFSVKGLSIKRMISGRARIFTGDSSEYVELNRDKGILVVKERIDREELCETMTLCNLQFQIVLDNPIEFYRVTVEIVDVNDNAPVFPKGEVKLEISEQAVEGARFVLESAVDPDYIDVLDANDNAPVFTQRMYKASVMENVLKGTAVTRVSASDADKGSNAQITYSISHTKEGVSEIFSINPATGEVSVTVTDGMLDREAHSAYNITITANDEGLPPLSNTLTLTLKISDVNDNSPVFEMTSYTAYITENNIPGLSLFSVKAKDSDWNQNARVSYILEDNSEHIELIRDKGTLVIKTQLDRESQEEISLLLTAIDGGEPQMSGTVKIHITVVDANDNAPVFTQRNYKCSVAENALKGTLVTTVSATDADEGSNALVEYLISHSTDSVNEMFKLDPTSGEVKVIGQLDFEKTKHYQLNIQAKDGGSLIDSSKIIIEVTDINDNSPVISVMSFSNSVPEDALPGTVIAVINVQDVDSGNNGLLHCSILENVPFKIISSSNTFYSLVTDTLLDRETEPNYNITVIATDEGVPPLSSNITLFLKISDVNDNTPVFEMASYTAYVMENNMPGMSLLSLNAKDADWNQNARVSYFLQESEINGVPVSSYISINSDSGVIHAMLLQKQLDREKQEEIYLTLTAFDGGDPQMSGTVKIHITVLDANDNAPVFTQRIYKASITENSPEGTLVTTVSASDADKGSNAHVTYSLSHGADSLGEIFDINPSTGEVKVTENTLDRETSPEYNITITATDEGVPPLSSELSLTVKITDINDNVPVFEKSFYTAYVNENNTPGLSIFTLKARFLSSFCYQTCAGEVGDIFDINATTGELRVIGQLDFEKNKQYQLNIQAKDGGGLIDSSKIIIDIMDINDNTPTISVMSFSNSVPEDALPGTVIAVVKLFLTWLSFILFLCLRCFFLTAIDGGDPQMSGTVKIIITVLDANDNAPVFSQSVYKATVVENAPQNTLITTVSASDIDKGANGHVSYSISHLANAISEMFKLDPDTGELKVTGKIDFEKVKKYQLNIQAKDDGGLIDSSKIMIEVIDVNDNHPVLTLMSFSSSVLENAQPGTVVAIINVQDQDSGNNGIFHCKINENIPFKLIMSNTFYTLVTDSVLDRETVQEYNITITATDEGLPALSNNMTLVVKISDVNDNAPVFEKSSYMAYVTENNTPGLSIFSLKASDADCNQNARISYILEGTMINGAPVSSYVSVSFDSGIIHAVRSFDYEQVKSFQIHVTAQDGGSPPLSSNGTVEILITVLDANDNTPVFTQGIYKASVIEHTPKGTLVTTVSASDADEGINGHITYSISQSAESLGEIFELHPTTGEIRVIGDDGVPPLMSHLNLTLKISDENPMELYRVTIEITDVNDNAPSFTREEISLQISESAQPGAKFVLESAVDPDVGVNTLQNYMLKPTDNFVLQLHSQPDDSKQVEMVLNKPLDREKQDKITLLLTAVDGGDPQMSGTLKIHITVLDANDNAPVFTQAVYKAVVVENAMKGTLVTTVSATDIDEGSNAIVTYSMSHVADGIDKLFQIDPHSGEVKVAGQIDFEKSKYYQINIQAKDDGSLTDSSKILLEVVDVNDNSPEITLMSFSNAVPENALPGTVIAMLNIQDQDSGNNGIVHCIINENIPFKITLSSSTFYNLVTDKILDRETNSEYNITVIATDEGVPPLSSNITLTLKILDINDNAPVFEKSSFITSIAENNTPGLSVLTLKSYDADWNQNARISYILEETKINGEPVSSYISVSPDSGVIRAVRSFDYEQLKSFDLRVRAQDGGSPPLSSNVTVSIFVQDQNDNSPQVLYPVHTDGSLVAEMVPRSADAGYLVTKVVAVDADSGQNAWLSYKLLKATDRTLFEVGLQNGEIRTLRQNKDYNDNLTFYLVVSLAVVSFLFISSLVVILSEITDVNDNAPAFPKNEVRLEISESALTGARFVLERAMDPDVGVNSLQSYSLKPTDHFHLKLQNQPDGSKNVEMVLQKALDREKQDELSLLLTAMDGGDPHMSGTVQIHVTVLDANDNTPVFSQAVYKTTVIENALKGTLVTTVSASDADKGSYGLVTYSISNIVDGVTDFFEIDRNTGEVVITGEIDYEKAKVYQIDIQAKDHGGLSDSSKIIVSVIDVNDNSPVINLMSMSGSIQEDAPPGTVIAMINVQDPDSENNGHVTCSINEDVPFKISVSADSGVVHVVRSLDYEQIKTFDINVRAQIIFENPMELYRININIFVLDANDNAPVFSQGIYKAAVKENAEIGTVVLKVSASDADYGTNGEVTYIVSHSKDSTSELFELNPITGEVKVYGKLDFEKSKNYEINVEARDEGGLTDSSKVLIEILDVNDNVPVITLMSFSNPIREDSLPDTVIAMLNIKDLDSGKNGELRCSISENEPFQIKSSSSNFFSLVTNQVLDREKISEYNITIIATDGGSPPFSSNKTLTLRISDVNDNAPVFEKRIYSAHIMENNSPGVSIFSIKAVDADSGPNAHISYFLQDTIISGISVSSYFSVNSESGSIHAHAPLDREKQEEHNLILTAKDGGDPQRSGRMKIHIIVLDANDNAPVFLQALYKATVSENAAKGTVVLTVSASDADADSNGDIDYETVKSCEINIQARDHGGLTDSNRVLDRETISEYNITVIARDEGSPPLSSNKTISLKLSDVNDNAPVFKRNVYTSYVMENNSPGLSVFSVNADDADWGHNAKISYFLEETKYNGIPVSSYISVNAESGTVYAVRSLDYEQIKDFKINIRAQDGGSPPLSNNVTVHIFVQDANDNAPLFSQSVYKASVPENAVKGTMVTTVSATDADKESHGYVQYYFEHVSPNIREVFEIDPSTGEIRVVTDTSLDREQTSQYNITITAADEGVPSLTSKQTLTITISDVNDNAPEFDQEVFSAYVMENNSPSLSLFSLKAKDADLGPNARISYFIVENTLSDIPLSSYISINIDSGTLYAVRPFDYEKVRDFKIVVKAQDGGSPPLSSNVTVNIFVQDQNDNSPQVL